MESWIATNQAHLVIDSFRMQIDSTCSTRLDTINAPDCSLGDGVLPHISTTSSGSNKPPSVAPVPGIRPGEVGGIIVGMIIIVLLIGLLVVIIGVVLHKNRKFHSMQRLRLANVAFNALEITPHAVWYLKSRRVSIFLFNYRENQDEDKSPFAGMEQRLF